MQLLNPLRRLPALVTSGVAALGLLLTAAACSGDTPSPGQATLTLDPTEAFATLFSSGSSTTDAPVELALAEPVGLAELDQTIAFWEARAQRDSRDFVALNQLGGLYLSRAGIGGDVTDFARARDAFERSIASNRVRNVDGLLGLAFTLVSTHHFEDGRALVEEALAIKPSDPFAHWLLGDASLGLGDYDAAYTAFTNPAALNDTLPAHARLAHIEGLRGNLDQAELQWKLALDRDLGRQPEQTAAVHVQLGTFYWDAGHFDEASEQFDRALAVFPASVAALEGHAQVAIARGDLDEAIRINEYLITHAPSIGAALQLAELYEVIGRPQQSPALFDLASAIESEERAAGIATDLDVAAILLARGDRPEDALAAAERAYAARPGIEAADTLAWAHYEAGNLAEAQRYAAEALNLGTRHPDLIAHAGLIEFALGNHKQAQTLLTQVTAINPRFSASEGPLVAAALEMLRERGTETEPGG